LGEELFQRWVGSVKATPSVRRGPLTVLNTTTDERPALSIDTLLETVRAAVAGVKLGLPPLLPPAADESDDWFFFELEPALAPDYAEQDDLVVCTTRTPELKKSFLNDEPVFSGRFSNTSALFTYLKYQSSKTVPEERMAERTEFEHVVRRALRPEDGVLIGLGLGVRYSYIELALADPDCVAERLFPALRAAQLPSPAWLMFFDSELAREHIPVYPDAPAPFWV
jgi:hypothetical protein